MIFAKTVLVPANTSLSALLKTQWKLVSGFIYKVELYFPPGSSGMLGIAIHDASVRLYPYGELEYFIGDNVTISFDDEAYFNSATGILDILAYNLDDTYEHSVQIRIGLLTDVTIIRARLGLSSSDTLSEPLLELVQLLKLQSETKKSYSTSALEEL